MSQLFHQNASQIKSVVLGDAPLTLPEFVAVCRFDAVVLFSDSYKERVRDSREALERRLGEGSPIYGVNTGFGGNVNKAVDSKDLSRLQENILFSHACSMGKTLSREQVRAMILMMLNVVGHGYSAVHLELMEMARRFLNEGITPYVPYEGSVGGLSYITYISMTLLGRGRVIEEGKIRPADEVLKEHSLIPITLGPREGLGITSSMTPQIAFTLLALYDLIMTTRHADLCCTLCFEALRCTDSSLRADLLELKGHPDVIETAAWMRKVLADSENLQKARIGKVQDGTSIRMIPHMMGAFKTILSQTYEIMMREMNAVNDNPVFLPDGTALMGANWDSSYETIYCDALCVAVVNVVKMINTHAKRLVDTHISGLHPYLVENPGLNSGFMMVQYTVEGLSAEIAQLSNPVTAFYTATSAGHEGPNPLSDDAALKLTQVSEKYKYLVSMTMLSALQALDFIQDKPASAIQKVHAKARETVSFMANDDIMYERTEAMQRLVDSGELLHVIEQEIGAFPV